MAKASDFESEDCRFESCQGRSSFSTRKSIDFTAEKSDLVVWGGFEKVHDPFLFASFHSQFDLCRIAVRSSFFSSSDSTITNEICSTLRSFVGSHGTHSPVVKTSKKCDQTGTINTIRSQSTSLPSRVVQSFFLARIFVRIQWSIRFPPTIRTRSNHAEQLSHSSSSSKSSSIVRFDMHRNSRWEKNVLFTHKRQCDNCESPRTFADGSFKNGSFIRDLDSRRERFAIQEKVWEIGPFVNNTTISLFRYSVQVFLDEHIYATTTSVEQDDGLFWGENFHFANLSPGLTNFHLSSSHSLLFFRLFCRSLWDLCPTTEVDRLGWYSLIEHRWKSTGRTVVFSPDDQQSRDDIRQFTTESEVWIDSDLTDRFLSSFTTSKTIDSLRERERKSLLFV